MKIPVRPEPEVLDDCLRVLEDLKRKATMLIRSDHTSFSLMLSAEQDILRIERMSPGFIDELFLFKTTLIKTELYLALFFSEK